jgi:hypothetical protein
MRPLAQRPGFADEFGKRIVPQNGRSFKEAHYITITDSRIELKSVDYDRSPLLRAVKALSLSETEMAVAFKFFG